MKDDERAFLLALDARTISLRARHLTALDGGAGINIPEKRAEYLLEKWSRAGWWDYGVSARTGWLTDAGRAKAHELRTAASTRPRLMDGPDGAA